MSIAHRIACVQRHAARVTSSAGRSSPGSVRSMHQHSHAVSISSSSSSSTSTSQSSPALLLRNPTERLTRASSSALLRLRSSSFSSHSRTPLLLHNNNSHPVRTMSTGAGAKEQEEPIQGSAPTYKRHLVICKGVPGEEWPKKPEMSDPYLNLLSTAVRGQDVKVNFVDMGSKQEDTSIAPGEILPSAGPRFDLILFPDNVKFLNVRPEAFRDLSRFLEKNPLGELRSSIETKKAQDEDSLVTELVPGSGEKVAIELVKEPSAVLVCIHGSRDCRCGEQGGELYKILKDMVEMTGLTHSVKIYGVSHIGGHKYAPNTIMYPSGDWHGNLSDRDSSDAQRILFDALANGGVAGRVRERASDPIMLDKWRGRIGMNKEEQLKMYEAALKKKSAHGSVGSSAAAASPATLFSAPGEDLYEEDGMKEQKNAVSVDSAKPVPASESTTTTSPQKVKIVFETFQKVRTEIEAKVGERILDIVKDKDPSRHGVYQALECTCGGQLECATCHVYIEPPYNARLPDVTDAEEDMLEYAVGRKIETSRLGCQIKIKPEMEGMVVKLPQY